MKIFMTGAAGFVGHHLLAELLKRGHHIKALVREGSEKKITRSELVEIVTGDIFDPPSWQKDMEGCDAVINLIGIIREFPNRDITYHRLHFVATKLLVNSSVTARIGKFIQMSANGASPVGVSGYQKTKYMAEEFLRQSGLVYTIFRPSMIFGDGDGRMEFSSELAKIIRSAPVFPIFGDGLYKLEPVWVDDVAKSFAEALENNETNHQILHLGGGVTLTYREVIKIIGKGIGRKSLPTINIPLFLIRPIVSLFGRFSFFPITGDQLEMLVQGNICEEHKYIDLFKIRPARFAHYCRSL